MEFFGWKTLDDVERTISNRGWDWDSKMVHASTFREHLLEEIEFFRESGFLEFVNGNRTDGLTAKSLSDAQVFLETGRLETHRRKEMVSELEAATSNLLDRLREFELECSLSQISDLGFDRLCQEYETICESGIQTRQTKSVLNTVHKYWTETTLVGLSLLRRSLLNKPSWTA